MLTVKDTMTLDFEAQSWRSAGRKEAAIRHTFSESATRYYQRLAVLIERQDAEEYTPALVHRLRRQRDQRLAARSNARRLGWAS